MLAAAEERAFRDAFLVLLVALYVVRIYFSARLRLARWRGRTPRRDRTVPLIAMFAGLGVVTAVGYGFQVPLYLAAALPVPEALRLAGIPLAMLGLGLVFWSHAALGRNWSIAVELQRGHALVTEGPYRWVRHPMYTGFLAWGLGLLLVCANAAAALPWVALAVTASARMVREERLLAGEFGAAFDAWAARTGRLLPRVRRA